MLPIDTRGMWIGTFHGLCNRMLRAHFRDAGLPQTFQILDTADQLSAIKRLMKGLNIDDEKYPAKNLQYFINNAKEQGLRPKDVDATDAFNRKFVELYAAYEQQCQREGVVDFAELLLRCYELLAHNPPLRAHYQARFQQHPRRRVPGHQQAAIRVAEAARGRAQRDLRGRRRRPVASTRFAARTSATCTTSSANSSVRNLIKLEQNYRSHGHILDAANLLIANNSRRLGKNLRTDAGHGEPVRVYEAATDSQEAGWIVEEIKALINTGARAWRDRGAVSKQRAVAHDRAHAGERGHCRIACMAACGSSSARK